MTMKQMKSCRCGKSFKLNGSLYNHIKNKHDVSTAKRGRPRKEKQPTSNNGLQGNLKKQEIDLDSHGLEAVLFYDQGLLDSQQFRKLICEFSYIHSELIYEKQIVNCNYKRASDLFYSKEKNKIYIEIVGFVQLLLPDIQEKILDFLLDELEQTKKDKYDIDISLQRNLTKLMKLVYNQPNQTNDILASSSPSYSFCSNQNQETQLNTKLIDKQVA